MATLKLAVFKAKVLKDGRHKIRIALCHKGETCYFLTRYLIDSENQFKNGLIQKRADANLMNMKLRNLLNEYQERLDEVKDPSMYSCRQLKEIIARGMRASETATFRCMCHEYVTELESEGRGKYAAIIRLSGRYFCEFAGGDMMLEDISPETIGRFAKSLQGRKLSTATIGTVMRHVKVIVNLGVKRKMIHFAVHPFCNFIIPSAPVREVDIPVEALNRIRLARPKAKKLRVAHDLFCLSFYLGGINLVDLMQVDFRKDTLEYVRTKSMNTTNGVNVVCFTIPNEAKEIAAQWMDRKTGCLDFGYKFSYSNFSRYVTRCLAALAEEVGVRERVVFYTARKSFAQFASEIGIPDGVIDYCLGHSDRGKGIIRYYTKVRRKQADMAIARVIDYCNNPDSYADFIEMRQDIMMMRV